MSVKGVPVGVVVLRKANKDGGNFALTVPAEISHILQASGAKDMRFTCELTEEGLLFRPYEVPAEVPQTPSWVSGKT